MASSPALITPPRDHPPFHQPRRRDILSIGASILSVSAAPSTTTGLALAPSDEKYVKETEEVIGKVRTTITLDKNDPNMATAVTELGDASNSWVAKYRREKARDIYSALNAVSGHYITFWPTAPILAKRKTRILEEMDITEKALLGEDERQDEIVKGYSEILFKLPLFGIH